MSIDTKGALSATPEKQILSWFDIAFGIVLPIICLALDLSIMRVSTIAPFAFWGVAALGIFALTLARFKTSFAIGEVIIGMLGTSAVVAGLIGIALVALAGFSLLNIGILRLPSFSSFTEVFLFGLIYSIALLTLVPFLTAKVFFNHTVRLAKRPGKRNIFMIAVGGLFVATFPLTANYLEHRWLTPHIVELNGNNPEMRLNALRALNNYPFTLGRGKSFACHIATRGAGIDEPTMRELEIMLGPNIRLECSS